LPSHNSSYRFKSHGIGIVAPEIPWYLQNKEIKYSKSEETGKMKRRFLTWLVAALIASGTSLGTAHAQSVTTLDPGAVAPGTNVTGSFAGVTLLTFSLQDVGALPSGAPLYAPSYAPVYADSVGPGQQISVTSVFSTNPSPTNSQPFYGLGTGVPGSCFTACSGYDLPFLFGIGTPLLIEFASPVTSVSILEDENNYNGVYMEAFNTSNQIAGNCGTNAVGPLPVGNYGCYSVVTDPPNLVNQEVETSISSSGGISKILIGGYNNGVAISTIKYSAFPAPEIDPASAASGLTLLLGGLMILGGRRPVK
jgi:hypothetical protein